MGKLIFIGGNRGIGKTELSLRISKEISFDYVQYSQFCMDVSKKLHGVSDWVTISRNSKEIHNEFINHVTCHSDNGVIVDGHYSYYNNPPFNDEEFIRMIGNSRSLLVLLKSPVELILQRIRKDPRDRKTTRASIEQDLYWNDKMYYHFLSRALERKKMVKGVVIENIDFSRCLQKFYSTIDSFFENT